MYGLNDDYLTLNKYLESGRYEEAEKIIKKMPSEDEELNALLYILNYSNDSMYVYSFCRYMENKYKTDFWEYAERGVLHQGCSLEGAYSVALFHAREMLKKDYCEENLEELLFYNVVPEKPLEDDEALEIANEILKMNPENAMAWEIKNRRKRYKKY